MTNHMTEEELTVIPTNFSRVVDGTAFDVALSQIRKCSTHGYVIRESFPDGPPVSRQVVEDLPDHYVTLQKQGNVWKTSTVIRHTRVLEEADSLWSSQCHEFVPVQLCQPTLVNELQKWNKFPYHLELLLNAIPGDLVQLISQYIFTYRVLVSKIFKDAAGDGYLINKARLEIGGLEDTKWAIVCCMEKKIHVYLPKGAAIKQHYGTPDSFTATRCTLHIASSTSI